jgi:hypothetical protein
VNQIFNLQYDSFEPNPLNFEWVLQRLGQATVPFNITALIPQWILIAQAEIQPLLTLPNTAVSSVLLAYYGDSILDYVD